MQQILKNRHHYHSWIKIKCKNNWFFIKKKINNNYNKYKI